MHRLAATLVLAAALGGCLTPSAYRQSKALIGRPLGEAVARYGPPDQPLAERAATYSWSHGALAGACKLSVRTDAEGRITHANVVAVGFDSCERVLAHARADAPRAR
jgi:hypothetical protein